MNMDFPALEKKSNFIIDSIHGDIELEPIELKVIDTPSFQRLRYLKQLQMGHLTYPNATHTRFAHSVGTLKIMDRVIQIAMKEGILRSNDKKSRTCLRLAALLHDIGHYPYSHLMETIDKVNLLDDEQENTKTKQINLSTKSLSPYPDHTELGYKIVTTQPDIKELTGEDVAIEVADLFSANETTRPELSKLISSSFDFDRCDYLIRDSIATGLPYGQIDLNYLLHRLKVGKDGIIGVDEKAVPAVEHFLLSRYFMYRNVYYHRTTAAFEEACRHLLKRLRNKGKLPKDGNEILELVSSPNLFDFTDSYIDKCIKDATTDDDPTIRALGRAIQSRTAPKLINEVLEFEDETIVNSSGEVFRKKCHKEIQSLAKGKSLDLGRFLFYMPKPISLEKGQARFTRAEYESLPEKELEEEIRKEREIIRIYSDDSDVPKSLRDIKHSIVRKFEGHVFRIYRLYYVADKNTSDDLIKELKKETKDWHDFQSL